MSFLEFDSLFSFCLMTENKPMLCSVLPSSSQNILEIRPKNSSHCFGTSSVVSGGVQVCHVPYFVRLFQRWQVKVVIGPPENFVSALPRVNHTTLPKPAEQELEESRRTEYRRSSPSLHLQCPDTFSPKPLLPDSEQPLLPFSPEELQSQQHIQKPIPSEK